MAIFILDTHNFVWVELEQASAVFLEVGKYKERQKTETIGIWMNSWLVPLEQ